MPYVVKIEFISGGKPRVNYLEAASWANAWSQEISKAMTFKTRKAAWRFVRERGLWGRKDIDVEEVNS
jgi:pterin-4a-carbinolamine dehydratase